MGLIGWGWPAGQRRSLCGCTGNLFVSLNNLIMLKGDVGNGASTSSCRCATTCLWQPIATPPGSTTSSSSLAVSSGYALRRLPVVQQAKMLLKPSRCHRYLVAAADQPGGVEGGQRLCDTLPCSTSPRRARSATPPVPPGTLATTPTTTWDPAPTLTVNPAGHGYVNLATTCGPTLPVSATTGRPAPTR